MKRFKKPAFNAPVLLAELSDDVQCPPEIPELQDPIVDKSQVYKRALPKSLRPIYALKQAYLSAYNKAAASHEVPPEKVQELAAYWAMVDALFVIGFLYEYGEYPSIAIRKGWKVERVPETFSPRVTIVSVDTSDFLKILFGDGQYAAERHGTSKPRTKH
jgi:hypothetical protein